MSQLNKLTHREAERSKFPFLCLFFLFYSFWRLWKTGWVPLKLGRAIYLTESTDSNANFIKKYSYRCTPKQYLSCVLLVLFIWQINLTITQGLADCFCKGSDSKYFRFCGPHIVPPPFPFNYLKMWKPFFLQGRTKIDCKARSGLCTIVCQPF